MAHPAAGHLIQALEHAVAAGEASPGREAARNLITMHAGRAHSCPDYDFDSDLADVRFYDHEVCPVVQQVAAWYGISTSDPESAQ